MNQLQLYFQPVVRKQRIKNRIAALIILVICGITAGFGPSLGLNEYSGRTAALVLICIPVALFILVWNFLPHRGLAALSEPSRIVWYYGVMKGGHINAVMIGFDNGKLYRFALPLISMKEGFSQEAFQHLRSVAPGAATGYSEELRKAFRTDPASLRT
ncbi:MAG TPA: hypothetical protein PK907_05970 [Candidatus Sabulitectum sp.]|nr:hypothetical protein [Candidatus Sabulitectum sp.]